MATIAHRPRHPLATPPFRTGRRDHWVLLSIVSVLLAVIATGSLIKLASGLDFGEPLPHFVAAVNEGDTTALTELLVADGEPWLAHSEWLIATEANLSLTGCATGRDGLMSCEVHFGDSWFYSRAGASEISRRGSLSTVLTVEVIGDQLQVVDWPFPVGLVDVEEPFRLWVLRNHPDVAKLMWEFTPHPRGLAGQVRVDATAGEARMSLLEEYLLFLNPPSSSIRS